MKASTFIRLQAKFKLAAVRIDEDGIIQPDYGAAYFLLLLTYLGLSGYFLYLRYSSINVVTFNTICIEFVAIGFVMAIGFKVKIWVGIGIHMFPPVLQPPASAPPPKKNGFKGLSPSLSSLFPLLLRFQQFFLPFSIILFYFPISYYLFFLLLTSMGTFFKILMEGRM